MSIGVVLKIFGKGIEGYFGKASATHKLLSAGIELDILFIPIKIEIAIKV